MKTGFQITNEALFSSKVLDIDTSGLKCNDYPSFVARGTLSIEMEGRGWEDFTGEHGARDYEEDFGFRLIVEK